VCAIHKGRYDVVRGGREGHSRCVEHNMKLETGPVRPKRNCDEIGSQAG